MNEPNPYPVHPVPVSQKNQLVLQLSLPIFQAHGWLKFRGNRS
jgi:hypothetical protein